MQRNTLTILKTLMDTALRTKTKTCGTRCICIRWFEDICLPLTSLPVTTDNFNYEQILFLSIPPLTKTFYPLPFPHNLWSSPTSSPQSLPSPPPLLLLLLHWPGRSASLSSSPPPPPASACGPSHPEASSRPPLASSAPPPTSAAEPAPPSPGSVGRGDGGTDGKKRGKNKGGEKGRQGQYVNFGQILQYKVNNCQKRHMTKKSPNAGFCKIYPPSVYIKEEFLPT